ncbi:amidohydrolase family protein [Sediminibacterium roseum]|uniref:Amidohydrolase family protein n=1 Tax=Sediminibacterium roseum TaxID=1978412 RepID=A0ABW9ZMJ9_9BACT|nr:amidohydrolase family protein [Sediminibacterium roseum]NCI48301.1 amidohydrolase family protein [Sediminibacterium roseum]
MRKFKLLLSGLLFASLLQAQETFPVNGVADKREGCYAFTNATIVQNSQSTLQKATLVIRDGKIVSVGVGAAIPKDAVVIDCKDKFIYPSFIDIYTDYGVAPAASGQQGGQAGRGGGGFGFGQPAQITSAAKGPAGWNQAIRSEVDAYKMFNVDETAAKNLRDIGFGTVLSHVKDGIARGTGTVVTLSKDKDNLAILKERASAHYSFNRGTSTQSYPSSMMGVIALLRQSYLDAQWYKTKPAKEGVNLSLQAWNENQNLPQIFDANDKWNDVRAARIADEFGVKYIIKGGGNEYQRIKEIADTKSTYILSLNYPTAMDVDDPNDARFVALSDMKHWELAPTNPAAFEKANIPFCLTTADLRDVKQFMANLRKAIEYGLSESKAFDALTKTPATLLGVYDKVGSIEAGKMANFVIASDNIFSDRAVVLQNWVQGDKFNVKEESWNDVKGTYNLTISSAAGTSNYTLDVKSANTANVIGKDTLTGTFSHDGKLVKLSFSTTPARRGGPGGGGGFGGGGFGGRGAGGGGAAPAGPRFRLSGVSNGDLWTGVGEDTAGNKLTWSASLTSKGITTDTALRRRPTPPQRLGKVVYPFDGYGWEEAPKQETMLIKNATVWTNEKEGKIENADVLVQNGKIAKVGKNLSADGAKVIDATGKHVTAGIIDEHSHIAAASINEGGQSVTSEVRIADNLNPEDINIYRQLSGGVTTSHILHGSANTIGGQTQLIKLRWGANDNDLKFKGSDGFIKFALGENVKRTTSTNNNRFPDTRMGVEEVLNDAFARATDYQNAMKADPKTRRDLELDALVEIMNKKRFITCHSYVQSEITAAMRVGDKYGVRFNTFTHILEGYKVADKMKTHGSSASTFSDWWGYKMEVQDAMAYNAAVMYKMGLNVCINSDDAEMARRLNQEAGKTVKYGGVPEEDALKMVTLNPAKALHVDDKVGSIKAGKDADLVIWSNHPLSIYAMSEKTIVDGIVYFDREKDAEQRRKIAAERFRLVNKLQGEKRGGAPTRAAEPSYQVLMSCGDHAHREGLITFELEELLSNYNDQN